MKKLIGLTLLAIAIAAFVPDTSSAQTRIRFTRGRTSATVSSTIGGNSQRKFVLGARYGQTLSATVSSRNGCVVLGSQTTSTTYTTDSGDNWIDVFNNCRSTTSFTLTVSIY